jgi:hypothetical protein
MKTYLYLSTQLMVIALFANFLVEFIAEGSIATLLANPVRLFAATILVGLIGGYVLYNANHKKDLK